MNTRRKFFSMLGLGAVGAVLSGSKSKEQWDMSADGKPHVDVVDGVLVLQAPGGVIMKESENPVQSFAIGHGAGRKARADIEKHTGKKIDELNI